MGIKDFFKFLKKRGLKKKYVNISDLTGKIVAIDTSVFMYRANYYGNFQKYFSNMISFFARNKVYPIFVFDGKTVQIKKFEVDRRLKIHNEKEKIFLNKLIESNFILRLLIKYKHNKFIFNKLKIVFLKYINELEKFKKSYLLRPNQKDIKILKETIRSVRLPIIEVNYHEAEGFCSYLNKIGIADYVLTTDSDSFAYGAKNIIRDFAMYKTEYEIIYLNDIMRLLDLFSKKQLINFAILCGTDYNERIYGNGPVTSLKKIHEDINNGNIIVLKYYEEKLIEKIYNEYRHDFKIEYSVFIKKMKVLKKKYSVKLVDLWINSIKKNPNKKILDLLI